MIATVWSLPQSWQRRRVGGVLNAWFVIIPKLAVQITREDRMQGAAVDMPGLSMVMVRVRMDMEQGNREEPHDHPSKDDGVYP
jgi:hypothetical protein